MQQREPGSKVSRLRVLFLVIGSILSEKQAENMCSCDGRHVVIKLLKLQHGNLFIISGRSLLAAGGDERASV